MSRITAPALRRGLDILEVLLEADRPLRVPEIVQLLGLPRASVHELVGALVDRGYLQAIGNPPNRFALGVRTFQLGAAYERGLDLATLGRERAQQVAAECGETVQIVVRDGRDVVYIVKIDSTHSIRLVSNLGGRLPMHCTAGGKMLLSTLTSSELDHLFPTDDDLAPMTAKSITSRERLRSELATISVRGWSDEYCESNQDVACVAAPIYDRTGACVAAMSLSIPTIRWNEESRDACRQLVVDGARHLSTMLGSTRGPRSPVSAVTA